MDVTADGDDRFEETSEGSDTVEEEPDVKASLRGRYLQWRDGLSDDRHTAWSRVIGERLAERQELLGSSCLMVYFPVRNEVDLLSLCEMLSGSGQVFALPRVCPGASKMDAFELPDSEDLIASLRQNGPAGSLVEGAYGIVEPDPASAELRRPGDLDVVLVPGVVFDRHGHRIGYGAGYYDRFLARCPPAVVTIGVCFEGQMHPERLPVEKHDQSVDLVVTETETYSREDV